MADNDAAQFFGERAHPLFKRVTLIGKRQFGSVSACGLGNPPGDRAVIGKAHNEPALTFEDWPCGSVI